MVLTQSSSRYVAHNTRSLQRPMPWAVFAASPRVRLILSLSYSSTDRRHVSLGHPRLRVLVGVQCKAGIGLGDMEKKALHTPHMITPDTGASLTYSVSFQSLLYKNAKDASHRSRLSSEMMIYHMTVSIRPIFSTFA